MEPSMDLTSESFKGPSGVIRDFSEQRATAGEHPKRSPEPGMCALPHSASLHGLLSLLPSLVETSSSVCWGPSPSCCWSGSDAGWTVGLTASEHGMPRPEPSSAAHCWGHHQPLPTSLIQNHDGKAAIPGCPGDSNRGHHH